MTDFNTELNWYTTFFKGWHEKQLGPKPSAEMLAHCRLLGLRPGKQALACAMSLRPDGTTGSQIVVATGAPQLNRMRGLIDDSLFKREAHPADAKGHMVYKCVITPKGVKRIEANLKREAETALKQAAAGETKPVKKAVKRKAKGEETAHVTPLPEAPSPLDAPVPSTGDISGNLPV